MIKKAFTLIELLVVIAIIAILAAILFPVFAQAKVAAKKATSLSNQKQDALGVIMYANDSDDAFPLLYTPFPNGAVDQFVGQTYTWQNLVQPYAKNWGVFISPLSKFPHADPVNTNDPFFNYGILPVSGVHGLANFTDSYYAPAGIGTAFVGWNGIGGAVNATDGGANESWVGGTNTTSPSLTASGIASSADTLMTSDMNDPDGWVINWGPGAATIDTDTFHYCVTWTGVLPGAMRFGPVTRSGGQQATDCGHMRAYNGQNTSSFTDGHAKSQAILQLMQTSTLSNGNLVYTHLWPAGVN